MQSVYILVHPKRDLFIDTSLRSFEGVHCHALALLLIIFALGTLLDADRQSHSTQAQKYYHMARTVLAFEPQTTSWSVAAFVSLYIFVDGMFLSRTRISCTLPYTSFSVMVIAWTQTRHGYSWDMPLG